MKLTMMTFNIHHGRGTDEELDLQRIANIIAKSNADLIGLNEVDRFFSKRSDHIDQIAWLANYLQLDYAYGPALSFKPQDTGRERQYGNALLSRYPILLTKNHHFHFKVVEDRSLLETTIAVANQPLKVYVTHLSLDPFTHRKQTTFILDILKQDQLPIIVLGDWNMAPRASAWQTVTEHLQDAWHCAGVGPGHTFPSSRPRSRLDYIFLSDDFRNVQVEVVNETPEASDHLPVVATVTMSPHETASQ